MRGVGGAGGQQIKVVAAPPAKQKGYRGPGKAGRCEARAAGLKPSKPASKDLAKRKFVLKLCQLKKKTCFLKKKGWYFILTCRVQLQNHSLEDAAR